MKVGTRGLTASVALLIATIAAMTVMFVVAATASAASSIDTFSEATDSVLVTDGWAWDK